VDVAVLNVMATSLNRVSWNRRPAIREGCDSLLDFCASTKGLRRLGTLLIFAIAFYAPVTHSQGDERGEYELKAAFLFNFAKFVQWPPSSFPSPQSQFTICVLGDDPFGKSIDEMLRGKAIGEHPVIVTRCRSLPEAAHCQIVFISSSEKKRLPEILAALKGSSTLAVGETDGFAVSGGVIQFTLEEQHVHFIINVNAAEQAGLQISSKLLALAKVVRDVPLNGKS
jgi:YfiR/HmsC-like